MLITTKIALGLSVAVATIIIVKALVTYVKAGPARLAAWQAKTGLECRVCYDTGILHLQGGDCQGCTTCGRGTRGRKAERLPRYPLINGVPRPHLLGTQLQPTAGN